MSRKFLRRYLPTQNKLQSQAPLNFLSHLADDPNLFHLNRHSVSMAFGVGFFVSFLPLPGQMALASLGALLLRCNLPIAVALIWVTNPITVAPLFFFAYKWGSWVLQSEPIQFSVELSWQWFSKEFLLIWKPLVVGCLLCGTSCGLGGFLMVKIVWRLSVLLAWHRRKELRKFNQP